MEDNIVLWVLLSIIVFFLLVALYHLLKPKIIKWFTKWFGQEVQILLCDKDSKMVNGKDYKIYYLGHEKEFAKNHALNLKFPRNCETFIIIVKKVNSEGNSGEKIVYQGTVDASEKTTYAIRIND